MGLSLLMRVMNKALTVGLDFPGHGLAGQAHAAAAAEQPHRNGAFRRYTAGSQGLRARWAGVHLSIWTIVWCTHRR